MTRRRAAGANARVRAASQYAAWRAEGVPSLITAHEAWRLTDGAVGTKGDHGSTGAMNLSTVARDWEARR